MTTTPSPIRFSMDCPLCVSAVATGIDEGFTATSVEVIPCPKCREDFMVLSVRIRKSRAYCLASSHGSVNVRHADGLVEFVR